MPTIAEVLAERPYPGRGCVAARTTADALCLAYFITGRSPASRARRLVELDGGDIAVENTNADRVHDALRHYVAGARRGEWMVVGNGDQVVPIAESLAGGVDAVRAAAQHTFEPDPPIFTPRIWLAARLAGPDSECSLGYVRRSERNDGGADRVVWTAGGLGPGSGILMTTYDGSVEDVHTTRVPRDIFTNAETVTEVLHEVWASLDSSLRITGFALDPANDSTVVTTDRLPALPEGEGIGLQPG